MTSVERGTRWMLFERNAQPTWTMARAQVEAFLDSLYAEGAFAGRSGEESYFVVCDERINTEETLRAGKVNLAFGFAATKPGEYHAFIVTHQPSGSRARSDQREPLRELFAERGSRNRVEHPARAGAAAACRCAGHCASTAPALTAVETSVRRLEPARAVADATASFAEPCRALPASPACVR